MKWSSGGWCQHQSETWLHCHCQGPLHQLLPYRLFDRAFHAQGHLAAVPGRQWPASWPCWSPICSDFWTTQNPLWRTTTLYQLSWQGSCGGFSKTLKYGNMFETAKLFFFEVRIRKKALSEFKRGCIMMFYGIHCRVPMKDLVYGC